MPVTSIFYFSPNVFKSLFLTLYHIITAFNGPVQEAFLKTLWEKEKMLVTCKRGPFENNVGKGENAGNQHFLLFPECFLLFLKQISLFQLHWFCRLQMLSIWTSLKFCYLFTYILHWLRNKFLQLILISLDSASWELRLRWMKIPKLAPTPENGTVGLKIARPTLHLTTTDTIIFRDGNE